VTLCDEGEGGVIFPQNCVTSFIDNPLSIRKSFSNGV